MNLLRRLRNWFAGLGGDGWLAAISIACLLTACALGISSCAAMSKPVTDPATGQPVIRPDGTEQTTFDAITDTAGGLASTIAGNPLWGVLIGAGAALLRPKVLGSKATPSPVPPPSPTP